MMGETPDTMMVDTALEQLIAEVDAECRRRSVPMLGPHRVARLCAIIRSHKPQRIVEVGTAIGYSGLWIAATLREIGTGHLWTLEMNPDRAAEAAGYFRRAGLEDWITQLVGDARERIGEVPGPIDLLFLDGGFENYYPCLLRCRAQLHPGAVLVADNAGIGATEMADYLAYVRQHLDSQTEWFDTDLSWNPRDAMEISIVRSP
jgi:predicted O-methyltransferase YrrM